ncbi:putative sulfate exporter family transporter, partial [Atlantibacter subterraneus]|uniref:putative sulfate exporter family transporter n=1 Tax=Atlantibacter subterraneus TaxID=255519 RepID=UPI002FDD0BDC
MAEITSTHHRYDVKRFILGLALTAVIAFATAWIGNIPAVSGLGLGALTLAIIVGIVLGNTLYPAAHPLCDEGVQFAKQ